MAKTPFELRNEVLAQRVVKNLQRRAFDACYCATKEEALEKALSLIDKKQCVSWGGSMTLEEMGLLETLRTQGYNIIDRDTAKSQEERLELLRKALTCDTYFMSTNAMSEDGVMVNIDGTGNRVAAMVFGPKSVVVIAGINKVVKSYEDAVAPHAIWQRRLMYSALPILTRRAKITGTALTAPRPTASATLF